MATKKTKTIKWISKKNKAVCFTDSDDVYDITDKIAKLPTKKVGLVNGAKVEVSFGDDDTVYYIKKLEDAPSEEPKQETKKEEPKSEPQGDDVYTIRGIPKNKKVIKFKEDSENWYELDESIRDRDFKEEGLVAHAKVRVEIERREGDKDKVTSIELVEPKKEEKPKTSSPQSSEPTQGNYSKNDSIIRQVAWKTAGRIVGNAFSGQLDLNDKETVTKLTRYFADEGIKYIKE